MALRRLTLLAFLALAAMGSGCQPSDSSRAVDTVRDFITALQRADGRAACEQLAEAGISELLLAGVRSEVRPSGLGEPAADRCAIVAESLAGSAAGLGELRDSPVSRTLVEGDRATIETRAGAYEAEEVDGRWLLTRFDPVAEVLAGGSPPDHPVHLSVVRPRLREPALGATLAGRTDEESIELTGTLDPPDATLSIGEATGAEVERVEVRDGRFRVELGLSRGLNEVLLVAEAPSRSTTELAIDIERE